MQLRNITVPLFFFAGITGANENVTEFESSATVDQVMQQHHRLPKDDIWWTAYGEDMAWNFKNLHLIFPTATIYRAGAVSTLEYKLMDEVTNFAVDTPQGKMGFKAFIDSDQSTTMGIVILHKGKIVFEHYPRMEEYEKPVYWSVTKVFVSSVLSILEDRGLVDIDKTIETYIPELAKSSYAGVTVRNILDMASGLDCPEEYVDKNACYYRYSMGIGDGFRLDTAPDNPYDFVASLEVAQWREQGTAFDYSGVNTFIIGWLVEKITGMPFQDALSKEVWAHIGAEADASIFAPRYGIPVTHGGLLAKLRDVARFGLLFTPSYGVVSDLKIISDAHIETIRNGGNPALRLNGRYPIPEGTDIKHNVYQWDLIFNNNDFYKGGWAGQGLLVNPDRDIVAVYTGYFKKDQSEVSMLPILRAVLHGVFDDEAAND
jgi:CubicO group peptidase (beta-lactamase class C family)